MKHISLSRKKDFRPYMVMFKVDYVKVGVSGETKAEEKRVRYKKQNSLSKHFAWQKGYRRATKRFKHVFILII